MSEQKPDCVPDINAKPTSANEEAFQLIYRALEAASREYAAIGYFSFFRRAYYKGIVTTLGLMLEMVHGLHQKYENRRGTFN